MIGTEQVHALYQDTADQSLDVVKGTILIYDLEAYVLIDPGSTHSFVSLLFAFKLGNYVKPTPLSRKLSIMTPMNTSQLVEYVLRDCKLKLGGRVMTANLILMHMRDFDVILGMDWLAAHRAILDCFARTVTFHTPEKCIVQFP